MLCLLLYTNAGRRVSIQLHTDSLYNIWVPLREKRSKKVVFCCSGQGLRFSGPHGIIIVTIGEGDKHNACVQNLWCY